MGGVQSLGVGMIGLGVVGGGVARILQERSTYFRQAHGLDLVLRRVAVRNPGKPRAVDLPAGVITDDAPAVIQDPGVDILIEVMGGLDPASGFCLEALRAGKDVVTANKALLAEKGQPLFHAASEAGVGLGFEASVCGGIPIMRALSRGLVANEIESLYGILNGTTNYILTRMSDDGGSFEEMLGQAQERGYAEADPTMDIDGTDAAQKLALLCRLAFCSHVSPATIPRDGIEAIGPLDIDFARELGYAIKLLAIAKTHGRRLETRVHPALVPSGCLLANIKDEFNAVEVVGSAVGPQVFYGRGAGQMPTASAVVSDLVDLARQRTSSVRQDAFVPTETAEADPVPPEEVVTSFYCRLTVRDRPGVLAQVAQIYAQEHISIAKVIQHGRSDTEDGAVPLILTLHEAPEGSMRRAVSSINKLPVVTEPAQIIRIEEL